MTRVEFRGVGKRFGLTTALHPVDLVVEPGEFFTLLGPSGSGKTTLLRILAGLETASEGRVLFGDEDVTKVPPWQRRTAMVFQNYALYPHMTVGQNIGYPLKVHKVPREEAARRVAEVAERLSISPLLDRRPTEISGGQQQRVALARALVHQPRLFLFDEPLSNLDARLRLEARTFLKRFQREIGVTSIYVTHDQTEAMALSDRMAILEHGRLRQVGTPREVYRRPADPFVATFIGHPPMSLVPIARVEGRMLLGEAVLGPAEGEGPAQLGIRPEHVTWGQEGLPATVVLSEDFGHEVWVTVEVEGHRVVLRHSEELPEGAQGRVAFALGEAAVFPS